MQATRQFLLLYLKGLAGAGDFFKTPLAGAAVRLSVGLLYFGGLAAIHELYLIK